MENIGKIIVRSSKQGGGSYTIVAHINCPRKSCQKITELREVQTPSKDQRKKGYYNHTYSLCKHCGLYNADSSTKTFIKNRN